MNWTEQQLADYTARQVSAARAHVANGTAPIQPPPPAVKKAAQGKIERKSKKAEKKTLVIVLPFKLPTWNALLAMNKWQRMKERHRIHGAVLASIQNVKDSQTRTE